MLLFFIYILIIYIYIHTYINGDVLPFRCIHSIPDGGGLFLARGVRQEWMARFH